MFGLFQQEQPIPAMYRHLPLLSAGVYSVIATNTTTTCPSQLAQTTVVINPVPTVTVTSAPVCARYTGYSNRYTSIRQERILMFGLFQTGATDPRQCSRHSPLLSAGVYSVIATNTTTTCPSQPAQTTVVINPVPTVTVTQCSGMCKVHRLQ